MFRDLKEYQELAKIYVEKVSKPEDLDENRNTRGQALRMQRERNKPQTDSTGKVIPSTAQIRAKDDAAGGSGMSNIPKKEGDAVINAKKINPDFKKKVDIKKEFPDKSKVSTTTSQGKPRTKAQMMAAKRIAAGKSISDVKQSSRDAMKARAAERFAAFKAKRAEKKAAMEEYTPYDYVLEYLLSSEQAATIEEANYVMTEMDAETIQGIVEAQKKTLMKEQG